jgi:hypothetical protein
MSGTPLIVKGRPRFGIFDEPVGPIRPDDFVPRNPMGGRAGFFARRFGFKHFQFMGAVSPELFAACAMAWTGLVANAFLYVFDPAGRRMIRHDLEAPLGRGYRYNPDPDDGASHLEKGGTRIEMRADAARGEKRLLVQRRDGLEIDLSFRDAPPFEPMRICTQTGAAGWTYAQKVAGVPARGRVRCAWGDFDLAAQGAHAHHDFTAGYLRHETWWHWACLSGLAADGARIGLNLSCGVNETSFTENCVWHDGKLIKVDGATFDFDPDDLMQRWAVRSPDGRVALDFTPIGRFSTRRNFLVVAANFHQLFGRFDGVLPGASGPVEVRELLGFTERQYVRW